MEPDHRRTTPAASRPARILRFPEDAGCQRYRPCAGFRFFRRTTVQCQAMVTSTGGRTLQTFLGGATTIESLFLKLLIACRPTKSYAI